MPSEAQIPTMPVTPGFAMLRTLGGIATLSGLLVVLVYQWTLPAIEENQRVATEQAVLQVVPGAVSQRDFRLGPDGAVPADQGGAGELIYAAYDEGGGLKGIALQAAATGYQDVIRLLYGYDPGCECIRGIKVLKMTETPGLGDKIITDKEFLKNFEALDAEVNPSGDGLRNPIVTVKHGSKRSPWEIDAISGATISSKAVGRALNESAQRMAGLVKRHLAVMEGRAR
jgi:electron transport complex protein RnfG